MSVVCGLVRWRDVIDILAAVWVGGACIVGLVVAPTLFAFISDRALAGDIAGFLFRLVNVSGATLFAGVLWRRREHLGGRARRAVASVIVGCALQVAVLAPLVSMARAAHASWFGLAHGASTVVYLGVLVAASYWLSWLVVTSGASK